MVNQATAGNSLGQAPGPVGMLSKMSGRLIAFYSDDLADALVDDLLREAAIDMNKIEEKERNKYQQKESAQLAEAIMEQIADYKAQEHLMETRWTN